MRWALQWQNQVAGSLHRLRRVGGCPTRYHDNSFSHLFARLFFAGFFPSEFGREEFRQFSHGERPFHFSTG